MLIEDGTGKGYKLKINKDNRLYSYSVTSSHIHDIAEERKRAFVIPIDDISIGTTESSIAAIKNNSADEAFVIVRIIVSINDEGAEIRVKRDGEFSGGTQVSAVNLNSAGSSAPSLDIYTGATITGTEQLLYSAYLKQNQPHSISFDDIFYVLKTTATLNVTAKATAAGKNLKLVIIGYFEKED